MGCVWSVTGDFFSRWVVNPVECRSTLPEHTLLLRIQLRRIYLRRILLRRIYLRRIHLRSMLLLTRVEFDEGFEAGF